MLDLKQYLDPLITHQGHATEDEFEEAKILPGYPHEYNQRHGRRTHK